MSVCRHAFALLVVLALSALNVSDACGFDGSTTAPTTTPAATATTNGSASTKSYAIENHGELNLAIPAGWTEEEEPAQPGIPRTLRLTDPSREFEMLISILPPPKDIPDFNSKTKLRAIAEAQGKHLLSTAKETTVTLEELKRAAGGGYVYTFADKAPAPGVYEYISGGVVGVGDLILSTTMLMHERNPPQRAMAIELLSSATQLKPDLITVARNSIPVAPTLEPTTQPTSPTTPATSPTSQPAMAKVSRLAVSLPDRTWQLALDQGSLQVIEDETSPDKKARHVSAIDSNTGVNVSIFLEPAATIGDAKVARSFFFDRLKRSPLQIKEDKFTDIGEIARVDYLLPDSSQRNANLYLSKEGIWIDVHISVEDAKGEKQTLIDEIAGSVRIEQKSVTQK